MKILITGFEPFDNSPINPSQEVIQRFKFDSPDFIQLSTCLLPVDAKRGPELLIQKLEDIIPDVVICLGQASGRSAISLEKVAINQLDFRIPDNTGEVIIRKKIITNAPDAYFTSLPIDAIHKCLLSTGIPCEISYTAGTYLCNQVFFCLMHAIRSKKMDIPAGFIHLPSLPEQAALSPKPIPSMAIEVVLKAIPLIINTMRPD